MDKKDNPNFAFRLKTVFAIVTTFCFVFAIWPKRLTVPGQVFVIVWTVATLSGLGVLTRIVLQRTDSKRAWEGACVVLLMGHTVSALVLVLFVLVFCMADTQPVSMGELKDYDGARGTAILALKGTMRIDIHNSLWSMWAALGCRCCI